MVSCECGKRAVFSDKLPLCKFHFEASLKQTIFKKLDEYVSDSDKLAVAVSGGKDSTTLLDIVNEWGKNKPVAICIDEGIKGYRDQSITFLKDFCKHRNIELLIVSFKNEMGTTLDKLLKIRDKKNLDLKACTVCGTYRRYLLNKRARKIGATKILFAHNRDDELQTFLMNLATGNINQISIKGELGGLITDPLFVVRFKPLMDVSEKTLATYAALNYSSMPSDECPNLQESVRYKSRILLNQIETKQTGAKVNLMEVYKKKILPAVKKFTSQSRRKLIKCTLCSEPSSNEVCKVCEIKKLLS
ncbi:MAG: TIGR00269 family protein [Candidatus Altiarchaeota archaeon]|nr:TIGR00269 family protein [Candidatus Altiarchaeota archaeon]